MSSRKVSQAEMARGAAPFHADLMRDANGCVSSSRGSAMNHWCGTEYVAYSVHVTKIYQLAAGFHPYLGKWSNLTNIFQMGWNHQLDTCY